MNRMIQLAVPVLAAALAIAAGCDKNKSNADAKKMATAAPKTAVAKIEPSKAATTQPSWGKASGTVTFVMLEDGKTKVNVDLEGVPPGKHGFHIHEKGDLSAPDLSSAGAHFNPMKHPHGGPDAPMHHAGDLGNVDADESGKVKKEITVDGISIGSGAANDIVGKSVILHAKPDDLKTQPSGDAGGRIAGGKIEEKK